jgi:hypothetical protein
MRPAFHRTLPSCDSCGAFALHTNRSADNGNLITSPFRKMPLSKTGRQLNEFLLSANRPSLD